MEDLNVGQNFLRHPLLLLTTQNVSRINKGRSTSTRHSQIILLTRLKTSAFTTYEPLMIYDLHGNAFMHFAGRWYVFTKNGEVYHYPELQDLIVMGV